MCRDHAPGLPKRRHSRRVTPLFVRNVVTVVKSGTHILGKEAMTRENLIQGLADAGRHFHVRGWVPATSGNFSARLDGAQVLITVSGEHKGDLSGESFMRVGLDGRALDQGKRQSAETLLHVQLYAAYPEVGVVLHTHSASATVLSAMAGPEIRLVGYELLKAFPGIDSHDVEAVLPVFPNEQDMPRLAGHVTQGLEKMEERVQLPAYLISGHGLYTWARTLREAVNQVEALEFIMECEMMKHRRVIHD